MAPPTRAQSPIPVATTPTLFSSILHPTDTILAIGSYGVGKVQDVLIGAGEWGLGLGYVEKIGREGIIGMMRKNITSGQLTLHTPTETYIFPSPTSSPSSSSLSSTPNRPSSPSSSTSSNPPTSLSLSTTLPTSPSSTPKASITIASPRFWLRLLTLGDLGFAESYMAGDCLVHSPNTPHPDPSNPDPDALLAVFKIFIHSRPRPTLPASHSSSRTPVGEKENLVGGVKTVPSMLLQKAAGWASDSRVVNSVRNSVGNIRAHYDISNRMFASFLSKDMTYSAAIFPSLDSDLPPPSPRWPGDSASSTTSLQSLAPSTGPSGDWSGVGGEETDDELERAQMAKLRHMVRKAKIGRGMRVLEIGSGWGSFAMEAVRMTGCTVDTLTLSEQQKILAEERIEKAGMSDSITVHLMDFRNLPEEWTHSFDRLVSIEMLEAVGKDYIVPYFEMVDRALNENGVAVFQVITIPEGRFENYQKSVDFIRKWIFPGGFLPSVSFVTEAVKKGGRNRLIIDSTCNIGPHYARTLREWRIRFLANFDRDIIPALKDEHPEMSEEDIQVFKRKWLYYFVYCEVGFSERILGDHIFCLTREGNASFGSDVYV